MADESNGDNEAFATVEDLERRWHTLTSSEKEQAKALLADAEDLIKTTCPNWAQSTRATLTRVCCAVVKRSMTGGADLIGVSQHTQTAGSYSESYSYSNPAGDMYLTAAEKDSLGGTDVSWGVDLAANAMPWQNGAAL